MYKQIGLSFEDVSEKDREAVGYSVNALIDYYKENNRTDLFSAPSDKRSSYRVVPISPLPRDLSLVEIWMWHNNRFRKCLIKDISITGAGIILPFNDMNNLFTKERPFTILVEFPSTLHTACVFKSFFCKSVVRYDRSFNPPEKQLEALNKLNAEVHPRDRKIRGMNSRT